MADREKVIGHLNDCMEASRRDNTWVFVRKDIVEDAISLLKEQEPPTSDELKVHYGKMYKCKGCGLEWYQQAQRYCQHCGKAVKLE